MVTQHVRRALGNDFPIAQHVNLVGDANSLANIVGHQQTGHTQRLVKALDQREQYAHGNRILAFAFLISQCKPVGFWEPNRFRFVLY